MLKKLLFLLCFPLSLYSQDTVTWSLDLPQFTVRTAGKKETSAAVITMIKNNVVVSDGMSSEYLKKTPDRTVSDALKRINGVTIQNDKFVLVRGLSDRYNYAILNKSVLPSTEPDRKSFSFDIIPSNLIDNIVILKSATPSLPGDFAGGVIQVATREVSDNFLTFGLGLNYGMISSFKNFQRVNYVKFPSYFPSTVKFRTSSLNERILMTQMIDNPSVSSYLSPTNFNGNFSYGYEKGNWYFLASATGRQNYSLNFIDRIDYQSSSELAYKYNDTLYNKMSSYNGLLNFTYIGNNKYSLKSIINHQNEGSYLTRVGENYDNIQEVNSNSSSSIVKTFINNQFEVKFGNTEFIVGHNLMLRDQPDYRVNPIVRSLGSDEKFSIAWRDSYRFWSTMTENTINYSLNTTFKDIKIGGSYILRDRSFKARVFRYDNEELLNEITNNTDKYFANSHLGAVFAQYDKEFGNFKVNGGLRTEYNTFNLSTADFSGIKINVNGEFLDILPSINLSMDKNKSKFRFSASKTLSRPEFREVANFAYYDFVRNAQIVGNPSINKSDIYNIDLKYEYYPSNKENISVSLFGKKFINPIEQIVSEGSVPSNLILTYSNPEDAILYGIELELRKKVNESFDVYTNCTLSSSEVEINGNKRQLQGQSNYILNGGLNYKYKNNVFNVSYNRVGDRISSVGFQGYPDIYENSRDIIDFVYLLKLNNTEVKFAISDMLSQPTRFYQQLNDRTLININNEQSVSLSLNIKL